MAKYTWYYSDAVRGEADTREDAYAALAQHIAWIDEAIEVVSPDGATTYYYRSQADADADRDGAYAAQITEEV